MKREIELDFVRGLAILMVIDFHSPMGVLFYPFKLMGFQHFGWAGVDVFFVLSGFLVGGLLVKEWKVHGRIDSKRFLIRRGFKIWPQYYLFIFLMLASGHRTLRQLWGNLLNIQNYVGGVAHTWSLGVEEHAYLLLVLCLAIAARRATRMRNLFLFLAATTGGVILLRMVLAVNGFDIFSATHTRIDGILEGVLLAILYHYAPQTFRRLQSHRWLWLIILLGALVFFRVNPRSPLADSFSYDCANAMGIALLMLLYHHREGRQRPALYRFVRGSGFTRMASICGTSPSLAPSSGWLRICLTGWGRYGLQSPLHS
ncbi:MAG: acyltransferase [Edaphobacter sp.]